MWSPFNGEEEIISVRENSIHGRIGCAVLYCYRLQKSVHTFPDICDATIFL